MRQANVSIKDQAVNDLSIMSVLQQDVTGFEKIARYLHQSAGIYLPTNPKNLSLVASRLQSILRDRGLKSYAQYLALLQSNDPSLKSEFISALTTNTTQFFREATHFDVLSGYVRERWSAMSAGTDLRVWCAAASTGQEPYTILMTINEAINGSGGLGSDAVLSSRFKMLATDIDLEVLKKASKGQYRHDEIQGVPALLQKRYFHSLQHSSAPGLADRPDSCVKAPYRDAITFAPFNLLTEPYPFKQKFDVIFCRNVLIYFDKETCAKVIEKLAQQLRPGGVLFLGHSESGMVRCSLLRSIASAAFERI